MTFEEFKEINKKYGLSRMWIDELENIAKEEYEEHVKHLRVMDARADSVNFAVMVINMKRLNMNMRMKKLKMKKLKMD